LTNSKPAPKTVSSRAEDIAVAARNAFKLALSLTATWSLALIVRIQLPRHLGPVTYGHLNFAESFAAAFFVFIGFGLETYVQKEVSINPDHASDFFAGMALVRGIVSVFLCAALSVTLLVTHRPASLQGLVLVSAITQYVIGFGQILSSSLRASTSVDVLAAVNVVSKLVWAVGIVIGIILNVPLIVLLLPALVGEVLRSVVLWKAARQAINLRWRVDYRATRKVIVASLPYFGAAILVNVMGRLDVTLVEFLAPGPEVGWYSASNNFASLAMLLYPVVGWILMPLLARAKHRSLDEFYSILRRALEGFIIITIPVTLIIALGAEFWVRLAFGPAFAAAALSLRFLAPMFVATYACSVLSIGLVMLDRPWIVAGASAIGIVLQPALTISASHFTRRLGPGGVSAAGAIGVVGTEIAVMLILLRTMGKHAVDRRSFTAMVKSACVALAVVALDHAIRPLGSVRVGLDLIAYLVLAVLVRVESLVDMRMIAGIVRDRRKRAVS
jgi:O-antigen/teichoic acid export membrane protein